MRRFLAVAFVIVASGSGLGTVAQAQDAAAFLAGTAKDCPGCNLAGASLKRRNLAGANLAGANLAGPSFHRSLLRGANFSGAAPTRANPNKTDLIQADFSNTKLGMALLVVA